MVATVGAVAAWFAGATATWLVGAALIFAVVPFAVLAITPTNKKLLDPEIDRASDVPLPPPLSAQAIDGRPSCKPR